MKIRPKSKKIPKEYIFSFLLPVFFIAFAFAAAGVYPFGSLSMTASDLREQFLPLACATATKLRSGSSIFYCYGSGFGTDLFLWGISLLTDPFGILFLIFPIESYQEIFLFTYIIKLGLTGVFACIYFTHSTLMHGKDGSTLSPVVKTALSAMYALCMYNVTYSLLVTLLTNAMLFPLCLLAQERLIEKKRPAAFAAVYFLCVMNSFYYAYFTGVCCFIYLIYYTVMHRKKISNFFASLCLLCFAAGVGICLSGAFTIPAVANILTGYSTTIAAPADKGLFFLSFKELMHGLLLISDSAAVYTKLDIFFGLAPLFFTAALVLSNGFSLRERMATLFTALFYFAALVFMPLYLIMHFGHMPNSFSARFAYCMAFMFIIFTARALMQCQKINKKILPIPLVLLIIGLNAALSLQSSIFYLINSLVLTVFAVIYIAALCGRRGGVKIIACVIACEALLTCITGIGIRKLRDGYPQRQLWPDSVSAARAPFGYTAKNDGGFYRQTDITSDMLLAPLVTGYDSYTVFSSSADQPANIFARSMGCLSPADHLLTNRYGTLVGDSILGVKYLAVDDMSQKLKDINGKDAFPGVRGRIAAYDTASDNNGYRIYKNPFAFPILFAADRDVLGCAKDFENTNEMIDAAFTNHERFIAALTGSEARLYTRYDIGNADFINCTPQGNADSIYKAELTNLPENAPYAVNGDETGIIHYSFPVKDAGEYCTTFYFDLNVNDIANDMFALWVDGIPAEHSFNKPCFTCDLGNYKAGETIDIQIMLRRSGISMAKPTLMRLDTGLFAQIAKDIQANAPSEQYEKNGIVTAKCNYADETLIMTTIAFNDGLKVLIDGAETKKILAADALLAFNVPPGSHSITITYTTPYLMCGIILSVLSAVLFGAALIIYTKKQSNKTDGNQNKGESK